MGSCQLCKGKVATWARGVGVVLVRKPAELAHCGMVADNGDDGDANGPAYREHYLLEDIRGIHSWD